MPIHQVTHINHMPIDDPNAQPVDPSDPLASLATAEERIDKKRYFVRNPKLLKEAAEKFKLQLERGRNALDRDARVKQAEYWKTASNVLFSDGKSHAALIGYIVGIWYLRRWGPPCPMAVAHAVAAAKDAEAEFSTNGITNEVAAWLGHKDAGNEEDEEGAPLAAEAEAAVEKLASASKEQEVVAGSGGKAVDVAALRTSLHLNAAAAALKLSVWAAAKAACEVVLSTDPTNHKALFRLAKALEGEGEVKGAMNTIVSLIKLQPNNKDARALLEVLKVRQAEEREKYKKLFESGGIGGGGGEEAKEAAASKDKKTTFQLKTGADGEMTFEEAYEAHVKVREASGTDKRVYDDESVEGKMEAVEVSDPAPSKAAPPLPKAGDVYARLGL